MNSDVSEDPRQTKTLQICKSNRPPRVENFYLGQPVQEINRIIPGFHEAYSALRSEPFGINKQAGVTAVVSSTDIFYKKPGTRQVPRSDFEHIDFYWHFFEHRLYFLVVKYLAYEPVDLQDFVNHISKNLQLPLNGWLHKDRYNASITCKGFTVALWTGKVVGSHYQEYPTVHLTDDLAKTEIERRTREIQGRTPEKGREDTVSARKGTATENAVRGDSSVHAQSKVTSAPMPSNQAMLLRRFEDACRSYDAQLNEIRKSAVFRGTARFYSEVGQVENWVGTLTRISTNQGGSNAALVIRMLNSNVHDRSVQIGSPVYNSAANLRQGQTVVFSGKDLRDSNVTERGKVCNPDFSVDLTSLRAAR